LAVQTGIGDGPAILLIGNALGMPRPASTSAQSAITEAETAVNA